MVGRWGGYCNGNFGLCGSGRLAQPSRRAVQANQTVWGDSWDPSRSKGRSSEHHKTFPSFTKRFRFTSVIAARTSSFLKWPLQFVKKPVLKKIFWKLKYSSIKLCFGNSELNYFSNPGAIKCTFIPPFDIALCIFARAYVSEPICSLRSFQQ